jgi:hypothetical protein
MVRVPRQLLLPDGCSLPVCVEIQDVQEAKLDRVRSSRR